MKRRAQDRMPIHVLIEWSNDADHDLMVAARTYRQHPTPSQWAVVVTYMQLAIEFSGGRWNGRVWQAP